MKKRFLFILLAFTSILFAGAKEICNETINLTNIQLWQQGSKLYVTMGVNMEKLKLGSDDALYLLPTITDGNNSVILENIIINGKKKQKAYEKAMAKMEGSVQGLVIPYDKKESFVYTQEIPYEPWMADASFFMEENVYGKKGKLELNAQELITNSVSTEAERFANMIPLVSYAQPPVESVKSRSMEYDAHVDFKVNQDIVIPTYLHNKEQLASIEHFFGKVKKDTTLKITLITLKGYASPEGPEKLNDQLAKRRTEAIAKYLANKDKINASLYKAEYCGENWEGLVAALKSSNVHYKDSVIHIIENAKDDAKRKMAIMKLNGGKTFNAMLKDIYPGLRETKCRVDYVAKEYTMNEAIYVLGTTPQNLSLMEMYKIAFSYPAGSTDFNDVFNVAVTQYPDDPIANLNATAMSLNMQDTKSAHRYMEKANKKAAEFINNLGVYDFYTGQYSQAKECFKEAAGMNCKEASKNLERMEELMSQIPSSN